MSSDVRFRRKAADKYKPVRWWQVRPAGLFFSISTVFFARPGGLNRRRDAGNSTADHRHIILYIEIHEQTPWMDCINSLHKPNIIAHIREKSKMFRRKHINLIYVPLKSRNITAYYIVEFVFSLKKSFFISFSHSMQSLIRCLHQNGIYEIQGGNSDE